MKQKKSTKKYIKKEGLQPVIDHIERFYENNPLLLCQYLDRAIYYFHFLLEDDECTTLEKQNICGALFGIKEALMQVYFDSQKVNV